MLEEKKLNINLKGDKIDKEYTSDISHLQTGFVNIN